MENDITLRTSSGEYVGGDTVYGTVYLCIKEAIPSRTLRLVVKGTEKCEYDYSIIREGQNGTFHTQLSTRSKKQPLIHQEYRLIEYPTGFPIGCFAFPFQYQLPHGIPGVFDASDDQDEHYEASIRYTVGAVICNPHPQKGLSTESAIIVYESLDYRNLSLVPDPQTSTGFVKTFFCLNRGTIVATSKLEKAAYRQHEVIKLVCDVNNHSAAEVTGVTVTLKRVLKLLGTDRNQQEEELVDQTSVDTILSTTYPGCTGHSFKSIDILLDLKKRKEGQALPPTTTGTVVKCSYFIDVDIHSPWSPDIEVRQPVLIKPPHNIMWERWNPPDWVQKCVPAPVVGMCAVPQEILCSHSFTGMPAFQLPL